MTWSAMLGGARVPKVIVNKCSTNGTSIANAINPNAKVILSGALTATTLVAALSLTGPGSCKFLSVLAIDTTSRTMRLKLTIDGVVVFDSTSAAITIASSGLVAIGGMSSVPYIEDVRFNSSFLAEIASSLSETDKIALNTIYNMF